jgi:hypothetical protein
MGRHAKFIEQKGQQEKRKIEVVLGEAATVA